MGEYTPSTGIEEYLNFSFDGITTDATNLSHGPSFLEVEYAFFINKNLLAFLFMLILCVLGTIGNIHTILVYILDERMSKLSPHTFILWLSSVDLILSTVCIPYEMYSLYYAFSHTNNTACKLFRYLAHALALMSGLLLISLARERYRKSHHGVSETCLSTLTCLRKLKMQSETKHHFECLVILVISFCFTSPLLVFLGIEQFEHQGTSGMGCTVFEKYRNKTTAGLYGGLFALLGLICYIICCYCYIRIIKLMRSKDQRRSTALQRQREADIVDRGCGKRAKDPTSNANDSLDMGIRLTKSLIASTSASFVGFILFVIGAVIRGTDSDFERSIRIVTAGLIRANFLNNAINPVAYILMDRNFRSAVKNLYVVKLLGTLRRGT